MTNGWETALVMELDFHRIQHYVLPVGERRLALAHELAQLLDQQRPPAPRRPAPARWLGERLVWLGTQLGATAMPAARPQ
jgi:hypothetical protein